MRVERIQPDYVSTDETSKISWEQNGVSAAQPELASNEEADQEKVPKDLLESKVKQLNETMDLFNHKFHFKIHDKTHRVIVQVLNSDTGEVVNEIPPEKVLDMIANMEKAIGLIVDKKA